MKHLLPLLLVAAIISPAFSAEEKPAEPISVLIITGDHGYHAWKETTPFIEKVLTDAGMQVTVTQTPARDLTAESLAKYDVLLLNYKDSKDGAPDTKWSAENQRAFTDAVEGGKGLLVYHFASAAFTSGDEWSKHYEKTIAGGWRKQGFHGKRHEFAVTVKPVDHPIARDLAGTYPHSNDELYQNSLVPEDATVIATAYSDPAKDPKNTGKDEPVVWTTTVGKGRVCNNALGHDVAAMEASPIFKALLIRGVEWAATGEVWTKSDLSKSKKD